MLLQRPHPDPAPETPGPTASTWVREPARIRQRLEATLIARVQRDPRVGAQVTELTLAVNVPAQPPPGQGYRRAVHATFLLLQAWDDAHQAFRLGCFPGIGSGALVRVHAAVLELMPFTCDYESIDHRLEARIRLRQQLCLLQPPQPSDSDRSTAASTGARHERDLELGPPTLRCRRVTRS